MSWTIGHLRKGSINLKQDEEYDHHILTSQNLSQAKSICLYVDQVQVRSAVMFKFKVPFQVFNKFWQGQLAIWEKTPLIQRKMKSMTIGYWHLKIFLRQSQVVFPWITFKWDLWRCLNVKRSLNNCTQFRNSFPAGSLPPSPSLFTRSRCKQSAILSPFLSFSPLSLPPISSTVNTTLHCL